MDCLQTVSELCIYISSVSHPVNETYQTLVSLRQSILCNVTFFFGGGGGCLICLMVKLPTGSKAFGPPEKDFALGSVVQILKGVGTSTVSGAVYQRCF